MSEATIHSPHDNPNFAPKLYGIALLVTTLIITGIWLVNRYTAIDFKRDQEAWQEKLTLIAESRASDINKWVADKYKELHLLADNPSLQIYMTELQMMAATPVGENGTIEESEPAPRSYLRNLLIFSAERAGFIVRNNLPAIPANVTPESTSGVIILNSKNEMVVSTILANQTRDFMVAQASQTPAGQERLIDMFKGTDGKPYVGFVVPVYSIQGDRKPESQIGRIVAIAALDDNFFSLLKHPGTTEKSLETILVRKAGNQLEYISPLLDGTSALSKQNAFDINRYTEAKLALNIGDFMFSQKDYRDKPVLGTSRSIVNTPWVMVVKIDRPEAYSAGNDRRVSMITFFCLMIGFIIMIIIAIWWYAYSKRAIFMSRYFRRLAAQAKAQEVLLQLVTDYQPESIMIVDTKNTIHFANLQAAVDANMTPGTLGSRQLEDVVGRDRAVQIGGQCMQALEDNSVGYDMYRTGTGDNERVVRSAFVPLRYIPVPSLPEKIPGVLVVDQDITEIVKEREQRMETNRQLVEMLVSMVDKRDPYSANHSKLVSKVAYEVAVSVALDQVMVDTTQTAANLMNIGKIVIPTELLTKTGKLTEEDKTIIRDSMNAAADMLHGIYFDGPVEDTLRQWQERWDGTGPLGLKHEAILISARIIAVANAFVGMISPRAWRDAIPVDDASKQLLDNADMAFDRRIVIALINYVENHSGREWLAQMMVDTSELRKKRPSNY
jgi:HD-GYP domain-containing protein (c-di-GMP phosphodiesterase class II)